MLLTAVLGMNLFGKLAWTGCIGEHSNFQTVPVGMLTLFGVGTKDRVACTMAAAMVQEPHCSMADGTCGNALTTKLFFLFFSFAIMFTTIEMFVNVILQKFEDLSTAVSREHSRWQSLCLSRSSSPFPTASRRSAACSCRFACRRGCR